MADYEYARQLHEKKTMIEKEMADIQATLTAQSNVGMSGTLVDADDFPRGDIDVPLVRSLRQRMKCLQTDHRQLMESIEKLLESHYAKILPDESKMEVDNHPSDGGSTQTEETKSRRIPILRVGNVVANSAAAQSGLQPNDEVIMLGSLCHYNFQNLKQVSDIVASSKGKKVPMFICRGDEYIRVSLAVPSEEPLGLQVLPV